MKNTIIIQTGSGGLGQWRQRKVGLIPEWTMSGVTGFNSTAHPVCSHRAQGC